MTTRRPAPDDWIDVLRVAADDIHLPLMVVPEKRAGDPSVFRTMKHRIEEFDPDVIETHDSKSHFLLWLIRIFSARVRATPWVAFHHGYTRTSRRVLLYQSLDRITLRFATHVITLCQPFAADLRRRGVRAKRISVVSNTVSPIAPLTRVEARKIRSERGIAEDEFVVLTVGRLSDEKGHDVLIEAFSACLAQAKQQLRLLIVGDGPERGRLEEAAAPLNDRVNFLGHVADAWPFYCAADLFVLPSRSEGSPLVIFEAMAASLPIVSTTVGSVPEVLQHGFSALLIEPDRPEKIRDGICLLLEDVDLRAKISKNARDALDDHTVEGYAIRLLDIYSQCIRQSSQD